MEDIIQGFMLLRKQRLLSGFWRTSLMQICRKRLGKGIDKFWQQTKVLVWPLPSIHRQLRAILEIKGDILFHKLDPLPPMENLLIACLAQIDEFLRYIKASFPWRAVIIWLRGLIPKPSALVGLHTVSQLTQCCRVSFLLSTKSFERASQWNSKYL